MDPISNHGDLGMSGCREFRGMPTTSGRGKRRGHLGPYLELFTTQYHLFDAYTFLGIDFAEGRHRPFAVEVSDLGTV